MRRMRKPWRWMVLMLVAALWCAGCSDHGDSGSTSSTLLGNFHPTPNSELQARIDALKKLLPEETFDIITAGTREVDCREVNRETLGLPEEPNWQWYYTYENLIRGMAEWKEFANEGDENTRKLEIAAFLANIAQETGTHTAGDPFGGPGCAIQEGYGAAWGSDQYNSWNGCAQDNTCAKAGYCGRGPHQLSWDYNYKAFGEAMGEGDKFFKDPDLLTQYPEIGIAGSIWFWGHEDLGTRADPQKPFKPSAHDVLVGRWTPTEKDIACGRNGANLGVITNIINGGIECVKCTYTDDQLAGKCCATGCKCTWVDPNTGKCGTYECNCCNTLDCVSTDCQKPTDQATNRVNFFVAIAAEMGVTIPEGFLDDCSKQLNFAQCPAYE
jgi:hypothetical protein